MVCDRVILINIDDASYAERWVMVSKWTVIFFFHIFVCAHARVLCVCISSSMPLRESMLCARYARQNEAPVCIAGLWCGEYSSLNMLLNIHKETGALVYVEPGVFERYGVKFVPAIISDKRVYVGDDALIMMRGNKSC